MLPLQLTASTLKGQIEAQKGRFSEHVDVSLDGAVYEPSTVTIITSNGALWSDGKELIRALHSCQIQVLDSGLLVKSFNNDVKVWLTCPDKATFIKLFASLIFWQALRPRGIVNKRLIIPFKITDESPPQSLLVASCKCFGLLPKHTRIGVQGPNVPLFPDVNEQWFTAMAVLKSNGELELINENDGKVLYSLDLKQLMRDEIRELHNSIFESSNYLYVGVIEQLRRQTVRPCDLTMNILPQISSELSKVRRIIMEFPYRIDVEDWLVALKSFTIRQRYGVNTQNTLRISRKLKIDILEVTLNEPLEVPAKQYCEVQVWGAPWFRTAIVESASSPFFREEFELDLPSTTRTFMVVLKKASSQHYRDRDEVLGSCVVEYGTLENNQLQRTEITGIDGKIGQLRITVKNSTNYTPPPDVFNNFEQMILNCNLRQLLEYVSTKSSQIDLEDTAVLLLDIFQSLQKENDFFAALIDQEITKIMGSSSKDTNLYYTLFRGNSLLTKSLELYNLRVGQEYLEEVVGKFISSTISQNDNTEIDPVRIKGPENTKSQTVEANFITLLKYVERIWKLIYQTSNDLPTMLKQQLTLLRKKIEMFTNDNNITLNCITGFIFLRFFCPVILNPKLFFLTKNHQTGDIKRTLTLISKILLTFANRSQFGAKEPYLMRLNQGFISKHSDELIDYLDRITGKKLDFTEKKLKLSSSLERAEILFGSKEILKELPTVPYLIDKYKRLDQLVDIISKEKTELKLDEYGDNEVAGFNSSQQSPKELYKIGSLEFEKLAVQQSGQDDLDEPDFEFGSEEFIKTLLKTSESEEVFNYIHSGSSLKDLVAESGRIVNKKTRLCAKLSAEEPSNAVEDINKFSDYVLSTAIIDSRRNVMRAQSSIPSLRYLKYDSNLSFKLRFKTTTSEDTESVFNSPQHISPKKNLSKMIRSASLNTLSNFTSSDDKRKSRNFGKWFRKKDEL
jgi:hypothetical protein